MTEDILTLIFAFIYTIGHFIGEKTVWIIQAMSGVILPNAITDTIGMLVMLTIFLAAVDIAKKVVWTIVTIGWILILIRIFMLTI